MANEGKLVPHNEKVPPKQQKTTKGRGRASSIESKEDRNVAEVRLQNLVWDLQLEFDGATIPQNSTIREF